jgi:hypothetical protein
VAGAAQRVLDLGDAQRAEVEHAGGQDRVRPGVHRGREVRQRARTAAGDHRDGDRGPHGPDQLQVEACRGPVRVHRVQQDLARAEPHGPLCPGHRVDPGAGPAAVRGHLEAAVLARGDDPPRPRSRGTAGVHGQHDALRAEPFGRLGQQFRPGDRGGVERDLVGPGAQQPVHVRHAAHAAADGERDEHLLGGPPHHVVHGVPAAAGRGDVEEGQLVGAFGVVEGGQLHRVPGVPQLAEVDPLDHPAVVDVQAGNDPHRYRHAGSLIAARASSRVNAPS